MKTQKLLLLLSILGCLCQSFVNAQVVGYGAPLTFTGTSNTAVLDTPAPSILVKQIQLNLTGSNLMVITGFTGNVFLTPNPNSLSNAFLLGSITVTNTTNYSATFRAYYTNAPYYVIMQGDAGTNTVQASLVYGP
ncbi:MAG: hypothetical protein KGL39_13345 [Patescibacteria group bacterium]|nr:hypothetical protein [Patescibacteria group bacterium]